MASGSTRVVVAALIGNSLIAVTKFIASGITGSSAMFAEAVHSVVDTGNQGLLLFGMKRAERPADKAHPFGYGKEIYFWAFVVAIILFALGAGVSLYEGVHKIGNPHPIENASWNYVVLALAMIFEGVAWTIAYREFNLQRGEKSVWRAVRESKDPALFTVLFEDTAAMAGLVAAFAGIFCADQLGWLWADGAATLVIGAILSAAAITLAIETKGLLIGEAASPEIVEDIIGLAGRASFVDAVNEVRTIHFGPMEVLVNLSVDARDNLTAGAVETGISELETLIKETFPEVNRVFVEIQKAEMSEEAVAPDGPHDLEDEDRK